MDVGGAAATGQWIRSPEGARWWFDSGSPALDLAWTGALRGEHQETLHTPEDLGRWLAERYDRLVDPALAEPAMTERELSDALMLRKAIANLTLASLRGEPGDTADIDVVNLFAATPDIPPALSGGSRQAGAGRVRATQALSTIARSAVDLFGSEAVGRIRECSADDCGFVYLDTSRSANRRWCSMQRCGNRAKVRAHRARAAQVSR
jgi:predicted RNA-binding Zn ribbon-like protein